MTSAAFTQNPFHNNMGLEIEIQILPPTPHPPSPQHSAEPIGQSNLASISDALEIGGKVTQLWG